MKELLTNWRFWTFAIAILSFLFSAFNFVVGKVVASKIVNNDLKHLTKDVNDLKQDNKEYRTDLKNELSRIFKRLGKIDKAIVKREAICNERHRKDK